MIDAPPPNLMQGIYLVQTGRKVEALAYLRHAARTEPVGVEGWLWLAAATDDLEEYLHCVQMALQLAPYHPVAQRMRDELARRGSPVGPPPSATGYPPGGEIAATAPRRARRLVLALLVLLLVAAITAVAYLALATDVIRNALDEITASGEAVTIHVGASPGFRFRVELPDTWMPADTDSAEWQARRAELEAAFPPPEGQVSVWEQVDDSFSAATRDPVYGGVQPAIRLVETDRATLERDGMVGVLTLQEIVPLPDAAAGDDPTVCNQMRALAQQAQADGSAASVPDNEVLDARVIERDAPDDCVFVISRRATHQLPQDISFALAPDQAPDAMRTVSIAVPATAGRYALWWLTLPDGDDDLIDRVIDTLEYLSPA